MKESYSETLARYAGPESYADGGNVVGVVTAGVPPGPEIELRKQVVPKCRHALARGRQHQPYRDWRDTTGRGGVEDLEHGGKLQTREPGDPMSLREEVARSGPSTPQEALRT
jgi:hypothetical protein